MSNRIYTGLKDINGNKIYQGDIIGTRFTGGETKGQIYKQAEVKHGKYNIGCNGYEYSFVIYGFYVEDEFLYGLFVEGKAEVIK